MCIPHNWEDYHGYHEVSHGNLHGTAWYRTDFNWSGEDSQERLYAFFEGVGSYASVFVNGVLLGEHAGGRTTFTVDLTPGLKAGKNTLAVRAHHPEKIDDLPFVCGGCWGSPNSEGSQPFGIFRPVWLEHTGPVRIEPFGVHVITREIDHTRAVVEICTEISNPTAIARRVLVETRTLSPSGVEIAVEPEVIVVGAGETSRIRQRLPEITPVELWSPQTPQLYTAHSTVRVQGVISHIAQTTFGLRWLEWPEIIDPNADRNVASPDQRGEVISTGEVPRTSANNGLTNVLYRKADAMVALAPMGVAVFNRVGEECGAINVELNLDGRPRSEVELFCEIQNEGGTIFFHQYRERLHFSEPQCSMCWSVPPIQHPHGWSPTDPYLHKVLVEVRAVDGELLERSETLFGIRVNTGPLNLGRPVFEKTFTPEPPPQTAEKVLRLNGVPIFLNGTCEYETLLGNDHAFTTEQIEANARMMRSAGFNAFRDAHHPHNLRYYDHWDRMGILCWTQMGSHVWFDTPQFRRNFRQCVKEWVRERRNHPCIFLWGIQNESSLPESFAREVRDLIRELDPSSPRWRLTVTCNGGKGSDWNVPQEWSGTYGGNCNDYRLETLQLVGEYGAWRSFGVHTETKYVGDENDRSESWACHAMEAKIRLGEEARDRAIGHFHWVFNSFPNPGRTANNHEGPDNGKIGSINNKGLITAWHQPSDLYYLFRSNYADPQREPMVYIVSHSWPDRWKKPGPRAILVYSNCEEVELYNGLRKCSLGKRLQPGRGRHFVWENVELESNILHAIGRCGAVTVEDLIVLDYLQPDPESMQQWCGVSRSMAPEPGLPLYRLSCGESASTEDELGQQWLADSEWNEKSGYGWISWGNAFDNVENDLASRGFSMTPTRGTAQASLYRRYRYGRHQLRYLFRCSAGRHLVRLHFSEPWFGVGGGLDCRAWRLFDIALNDCIVRRDFDIWSAAGGDHRAVVQDFEVEATEGLITLSFPFVRVNQALLCGIEIFAL